MQTKTNNMATVAKTQGKKKKKSIISKQTKNVILRAYISLYNAFLLRNLLSGMTLGAASHNAVQMVRAKIATMDRNSPVTRYLLRLNSRHSKRIAKRVMTSKYRDTHAFATSVQRAQYSALVSKLVNSAMSTLNTMSAQYQPKSITKPVAVKTATKPAPVVSKVKPTVKPVQPQQILLLQIQMKQMQAQNHRQHVA